VTVATGLSEVAFCGVSLAAAPTIDHTYSQAAPYTNPGDIRIRSYKPTATDNNAPAAVSAGEAEAVTWWAIGN
jgi:hypothetical protein